MAQHYVELAGSVRAAPRQATLIQEVPAGERLEISLYLKDHGPDPLIGAKPLVLPLATSSRAILSNVVVFPAPRKPPTIIKRGITYPPVRSSAAVRSGATSSATSVFPRRAVNSTKPAGAD